jgi:NAD(P)-dependent dehydrogenase (short-subunit alcohol dehydrogenase family)
MIVTGAGGGIGDAVARRLIADGWCVFATDIDTRVLSSLQSWRQDDSQLQCAAMDVSKRADIDACARLLERSGRAVAGLVNVAGVLQDVVPLLSMSEELESRVWDVNYFGAKSCIQAFAPLMIAGGGGAIVNITSINEFRPLPLHAYAPTKVALGALTQLAAGELGPQGIRVNSVAPGFTLTPILRDKIATGKRDASVLEAHASLGRLVGTDEIAAAISFLVSDQASAISGISLPVDAGWLSSSHWMNYRQLMQS